MNALTLGASQEVMNEAMKKVMIDPMANPKTSHTANRNRNQNKILIQAQLHLNSFS